MPNYDFMIGVSEINPEVEADLSKLGVIFGKIPELNAYFLSVEIKETGEQGREKYSDLVIEIDSKEYVKLWLVDP